MYPKVGNYSGVTIDKKTGIWELENGQTIELCDLPGIYSLFAKSPDERVVLDTLLDLNSPDRPDLIVLVLDASNLSRSLLLLDQISGTQGLVTDSTYSFVIVPADPTEYLFSATNANGCRVDSIVMIDVEKPRRANAPTAFTPNGDGVNDYFFIQGGDKVEKVTVLRVYDRWGELVFDGIDMAINVSINGWDGNYRGQQSSSGAYVWYAEVLFKDGESIVIKGDVLLIR